MQVSDYVKFKSEPRPIVICPHCEETSETWGEEDILKRCDGRIGKIERILHPSETFKELRCAKCNEWSSAPPHIAELGIQVRFVDIKYPIRVMAFPSELSPTTPPPRRKYRPWLREVPVG